MRDPWKLGMQAYSFRAFTFEEAVAKTKALGLAYIEAYPWQTLSKARPKVQTSPNMSETDKLLMKQILRAIEGGRKSVVLVGPPGVGKDAMVAGIASRMVEERVPGSLEDKRLFVVLAVSSIGAFMIPVAWNHDYTMWGDWNIAAAYLFPCNLLGWASLLLLFRLLSAGKETFARMALPMILVQILWGLGLLLQFYFAGYVIENS